MNRPFLLLGIGALVASFAAKDSILTATVILTFSACVTILLNVIKRDKANKGVLIALIFIVLILRIVTLDGFVEKTNDKLIGKTADIVAEITEISYNEENFSVASVKIKESSEAAAVGITVKATMMAQSAALPGDIIKASVTFEEPSEEYRAYNFGGGYYFSGVVEEIYSYEEGGPSLWRLIYNVRQAISDAIASYEADETGAVLKALIIGEKRGISTELNNNVKASGVSHMLVVSGMHLGIVCGVMMNIINKRTKRWVSVIIGVFTALFILAVCLFHVSILRASIAYMVMLIARLLKRNADPLSSLGFGVATAVLFLPYIFHNVAFLLSVAATFAVLYPARLLIQAVSFEKFGLFGRALRYAYDILVIAVCSIFCTVPIVTTYFGYVALAAPITNLAVTFAMNAALILGVSATAVFFLPFGRFISAPLYFLARAFVNFFIKAVNFIGNEGYGVVFIEKDKNICCFFIMGAFILLVRVFCKHLNSKREGKELA